jgi:hypothetical protein
MEKLYNNCSKISQEIETSFVKRKKILLEEFDSIKQLKSKSSFEN